MVLGVIVVVYWTARITNMDCLEESNSSRSLYASIREREREKVVLWSINEKTGILKDSDVWKELW